MRTSDDSLGYLSPSKGWQEALQLMSVGSTWEVYIPGHLAYGEAGSPPKIGPNSTLVFTVELLKIH